MQVELGNSVTTSYLHGVGDTHYGKNSSFTTNHCSF